MDKITFTQTIYRNWAEHFGCPPEITQQPGTTLIQEEKYRGDKVFALWYIGQRTFIQLDPNYMTVLQQMLAQFRADQSITAEALEKMLGSDLVRGRDRCLVHYLFPDDLPAYAPPAPYQLRQLTQADAAALDALKASCTPEEVDDGYVEVDHEIAFGCFLNDQLAAAASGYQRTGFMDIGVLTHAAFRHQGLGRAVVGDLCAWTNAHGFIAQYRCLVDNVNSARVARSLNFQLFAEQETIWMK